MVLGENSLSVTIFPKSWGYPVIIQVMDDHDLRNLRVGVLWDVT